MVHAEASPSPAAPKFPTVEVQAATDWELATEVFPMGQVVSAVAAAGQKFPMVHAEALPDPGWPKFPAIEVQAMSDWEITTEVFPVAPEIFLFTAYGMVF